MRIRVTYIHHDCFGLELPDARDRRLLLFDPPTPQHLGPEAAHALEELTRGREVLCVVSHAHADHFDPDLPERLADAAGLWGVVSDDVEDMFPGFLPENRLAVLEPEQRVEAFGITVEAMESNDQGLGFLLEWDGLRVAFPGDLADWDWPEAIELARRLNRELFEQGMRRMVAFRPQVLFAACDPRLASLAGGPELVRAVRPELFVPMHCFGRLEGLERVCADLARDGLSGFCYDRPGAALEAELKVEAG